MRTFVVVLALAVVAAAETLKPNLSKEPQCAVDYVFPHNPPIASQYPQYIPDGQGKYKAIPEPPIKVAVFGNQYCHFDKAPPPIPPEFPKHSKLQVYRFDSAMIEIPPPPIETKPPKTTKTPTKAPPAKAPAKTPTKVPPK